MAEQRQPAILAISPRTVRRHRAPARSAGSTVPAISPMTASARRRPGGRAASTAMAAVAPNIIRGNFAQDRERAAEAGRKGGQR